VSVSSGSADAFVPFARCLLALWACLTISNLTFFSLTEFVGDSVFDNEALPARLSTDLEFVVLEFTRVIGDVLCVSVKDVIGVVGLEGGRVEDGDRDEPPGRT
jgi:hypothetical protein